MTEKYTVESVTGDLGFLVSLTKAFAVDDKGFWVDADTREHYVYKLSEDDKGKQIIVFQDPLPKGDFYFFNPFSEGIGTKSPASQLYYRLMRTVLNVDIFSAMKFVAEMLLASKNDPETKIDPAVARMSSVQIDSKTTLFDVIDEKMVGNSEKKLTGEFEKLFDHAGGELLMVYYTPKDVTAKVRVDALTDPMWDDKYGVSVRKKSLPAFKALLMGVLGITDADGLEYFTEKYDTALKSTPKFHAMMSVYLKLYNRFNEVLPEVDKVDLTSFMEVIERLPLASAIAKHMIVPSAVKQAATATAASDTRGLSMGGTSAAAGQPRRFAPREVGGGFSNGLRSGGSLSIGSGQQQRYGRVIEHTVDPFAPLARPAVESPSIGGLGGLGGGLGLRGGLSMGGGIGLRSQAPSNFNSPFARRTF